MLLKDYREEVDKIATVYNEQRIENDKRYKVLENRKYTLSRLYSYEIENYINQEVVEAGMRLEGSQDAYNTAVSNTVSAATAKEEVDTILELRNINPSQPDNPGEPTTPAQPDNPSEPTKPEQPDRPGEPTPPEQSDNPDEPTNPDQPDNPGEPTNPNQPDNPGEPTNPDQPDNPGEPTNPDQPDNPGEPTNPNQPKPCYPTKIVIDIDGTITVNIVSEIEASIDFDGHFGIKFQP